MLDSEMCERKLSDEHKSNKYEKKSIDENFNRLFDYFNFSLRDCRAKTFKGKAESKSETDYFRRGQRRAND